MKSILFTFTFVAFTLCAKGQTLVGKWFYTLLSDASLSSVEFKNEDYLTVHFYSKDTLMFQGVFVSNRKMLYGTFRTKHFYKINENRLEIEDFNSLNDFRIVKDSIYAFASGFDGYGKMIKFPMTFISMENKLIIEKQANTSIMISKINKIWIDGAKNEINFNANKGIYPKIRPSTLCTRDVPSLHCTSSWAEWELEVLKGQYYLNLLDCSGRYSPRHNEVKPKNIQKNISEKYLITELSNTKLRLQRVPLSNNPIEFLITHNEEIWNVKK